MLGDSLEIEVDPRGRLIIVDDSATSAPRDVDEDGFSETIAIARALTQRASWATALKICTG